MLPFSYGKKFQESMLAHMMRDITFALRCCEHIEGSLLHSDAFQWIFKTIKKQIDTKTTVPTEIELEDALKYVEIHKRRLYAKVIEEIMEAKLSSYEFIQDRLTDYGRRIKYNEVFREAQVLYNMGKIEDAYEFTMKGMEDLYEITFNSSSDVCDLEETRGIYMKQAAMSGGLTITTGIPELDEILGGGMERGRVGVLLAEPKKGKTIGLISKTCAAIRARNFNVVHFVLEGLTEETTMKIQSRLSGIPYAKIYKDELTPEELKLLEKVNRLAKGRLRVVPMNNKWDYTTLDVESKLKELERKGFKADLTVIDYGDLLKGRTSFSSSEKRHEQTEVFRDLKKIAMSRSTAMWTASQAVRPKDAPEKEYLLRSKDISESYEKVRIVDFVATINQTPKEKKLGIIRFHADLYRNNDCDKTIRLVTDFGRMMFYSRRLDFDLHRLPWRKKMGRKK